MSKKINFLNIVLLFFVVGAPFIAAMVVEERMVVDIGEVTCEVSEYMEKLKIIAEACLKEIEVSRDRGDPEPEVLQKTPLNVLTQLKIEEIRNCIERIEKNSTPLILGGDTINGVTCSYLFVDACAEMLRENQRIGRKIIENILREESFKDAYKFEYFKNEEKFEELFDNFCDSVFIEEKLANFHLFFPVFKEICFSLADDPTADHRFEEFFSGEGFLHLKGALEAGNLGEKNAEDKDKRKTYFNRCFSVKEILKILLEYSNFNPFYGSDYDGNPFLADKSIEKVALAIRNALKDPRFAEIAPGLAELLRQNAKEMAKEIFPINKNLYSIPKKNAAEIFFREMMPCLLEGKDLEFREMNHLDEEKTCLLLSLNFDCDNRFYFNRKGHDYFGHSNEKREFILKILIPDANRLTGSDDYKNLPLDADILATAYSLLGNKPDAYTMTAHMFENIKFMKPDTNYKMYEHPIYHNEREECFVDGSDGTPIPLGKKVANLIRREIAIIEALYDLDKLKQEISKLKQEYTEEAEYQKALKQAKIQYAHIWINDTDLPEDRKTAVFEEKSIPEVVKKIIEATEIEGSLQKHLLTKELEKFKEAEELALPALLQLLTK